MERYGVLRGFVERVHLTLRATLHTVVYTPNPLSVSLRFCGLLALAPFKAVGIME